MGILIFFVLAQWLSYLWCASELIEIKHYQEDIDYCLNNWPACRTYTSQEIQLENNEETNQLMISMNKLLIRYNRFKNSCNNGREIAATLSTSEKVLNFVEEYDLFEFNISDYSKEKIFSVHLKYMGVFLASSSIMSAFSGDRPFDDPLHGDPYYKAITEPIYIYLKNIKEEIEYVAGRLGRLTPDVIEFNEKPNFLRSIWIQFWPLLQT